MAEQITSDTQASAIQPTPTAESPYISAEEYMEKYAHDFYEWINGELIKMTPVSLRHDQLADYLRTLLKAYFELSPIGQVIQAPFVMRIDATNSRREPDLQVILHSNPGTLTDTAMVGPADICIEVVSPESSARDYGVKFTEYEKAGVQEYWIIDPLRSSCRINHLTAEGVYHAHQFNEEGIYTTPLLPGLRLDVALLWQDKLPGLIETVDAVRSMLEA